MNTLFSDTACGQGRFTLFVILSVVRGNLSPRVLAESKGTVAFRLVPLRGEVSESVPQIQTHTV